jgi:hypothetical protein
MDTKEIRRLLREGHSVVLLEDGQPPLVVAELAPQEPVQEVPIASRWPKARPAQEPTRQDQILERLNKEILALKEQIAQEETGM